MVCALTRSVCVCVCCGLWVVGCGLTSLEAECSGR